MSRQQHFGLALLLSLLLHLLLLWLPGLELPPPVEVLPPPLQAQLVNVPKKVASAAPPPHPAPSQKTVAPVPVTTEAAPVPSETPSVPVETVSAVAEAATVSASAVAPVTPAPSEIAAPAYDHPTLPHHARLRFSIYKDGDGLLVGEALHRFEVDDQQRYVLNVRMNTTGIVSLFKTYDSEQISRGDLDDSGLRPQRFVENKQTDRGKEVLEANFDWAAQQLTLSGGERVSLPAHTQDLISALYQVSQLDLGQGRIRVPVTNGRRLEWYEFEVGEEQSLRSRMGTLRALPLRKIRQTGQEGLEIWLALEYRLLPVKFTQIDRAGRVTAEMVIDEIRVSD